MKKLTQEDYIKRATLVYGYGTYNYSLTEYINSRSRIKVICPTHGVFEQFANDHLYDKRGCILCSKEAKDKVRREANKVKFITAANISHSNFYDYSEVEYINTHTKVKIICPEHGSFMQRPHDHVGAKQGCPECGKIKTAVSNTLTTECFIERSSLKHNNFYDYSSSVYIHNYVKIDIICPLHGLFKQRPTSHMNEGQGCTDCFRENNSISRRVHGTEPATLYYIRIQSNSKTYYKVGVTKHDVPTRFRDDIRHGRVITTLETWYFERGGDAYTFEDSIKKVYRDFKTKDKPLVRKGNTEVFDTDILNLDN